MEKRFKFRITYRILEHEAVEGRCVDFLYTTFAEARTNYKSILLDLYLNRRIEAFKICLNRTRDARWKNPIYEEQDGNFVFVKMKGADSEP